MAFLLVLWIIVAMAAVAVAVSAATRTRRYHAAALRSTAVARWVEKGALQYVLTGLQESRGLPPDETQLVCDGVVLGEGAFWIIRPDPTDDREMDFGLSDEGGKIDLNTAPRTVLERLGNMTSDVAAAVVDWRDADEDVTPGGAESEHYLREGEPYNAKNAPFETTLELRLVAGVDDGLLYGEDTNRNGVLDPYENDGGEAEPDDDRDGRLDRGLAGLTTAFLHWPQPSGETAPVRVNSASREEIRQKLAAVLPEARADELAERIRRRRPFTSLFHLHYACGTTREELTQIEPVITVFDPDSFRLNVNAAGSAVLQTLDGLEEADAEALLAARESAAPTGGSVVWMLDALSAEKLLTAAAAGVTGRSWQYTADVVAVCGDGRAFRRVQYVIDVSGETPRVVYRQDMTHLGWCLDETILQRLRAGESPEDVVNAMKE